MDLTKATLAGTSFQRPSRDNPSSWFRWSLALKATGAVLGAGAGTGAAAGTFLFASSLSPMDMNAPPATATATTTPIKIPLLEPDLAGGVVVTDTVADVTAG